MLADELLQRQFSRSDLFRIQNALEDIFAFWHFEKKGEEGGLKRVETYFGINPEFQTSLNRISTDSIQFSHFYIFKFLRQEEIWK